MAAVPATDSALPLLFVHVPKTGGTTVRAHLEWIYGSERILRAYGEEAEAEVAGSPLPPVSRHRAIFSHCRIATFLPHRPAPIATMLRDPVERVLSDYRFARTWPRQQLHAEALALGPVEYAERGLRRDLVDGQTWLLSESASEPDGECRFPPLTRTHLDEARRHLLETVAVVGLSERFDESLALLCVECGIPPSPYVTTNRSVDRSGEDIGDRERAAIAAASPSDVALYAEWVERFDERWRAAGRDAEQALRVIRGNGPRIAARRVVRATRTRARLVVERVRGGR